MTTDDRHMPDAPTVTASFTGRCPVCRLPMLAGTPIRLRSDRCWTHVECAIGKLAACTATTVQGQPCRARPLDEAEKCWTHASEAERRAHREARCLARAERAVTPAGVLPPMPLGELLDYFTASTRELESDLWTLREAVDAHLAGARHTHAVAAIAELAERYALASDTVARLAADLRIPLSPNDDVPSKPW